jgi:hypothetical protein
MIHTLLIAFSLILVVIKPSLAQRPISFAAMRAKSLLVVNGFILARSSTTRMLFSIANSSSVGVSPVFSDRVFCCDWDFEAEAFSRFFRASDNDITCDIVISFGLHLHFIVYPREYLGVYLL